MDIGQTRPCGLVCFHCNQFYLKFGSVGHPGRQYVKQWSQTHNIKMTDTNIGQFSGRYYAIYENHIVAIRLIVRHHRQ